MRGFAFACLMLATAAASAADLDLSPSPAPAPPPPEAAQPSAPAAEVLPLPQQTESAPQGESWWQALLRDAPQCRTFSDGCRRCSRDFSCSGLPIACQPKEWTCADPEP
jgi:hypothetical protein